MATRMNMMKMLQETRSLAEFMNRRPQNRPVGPLLLQVRAPKWKATRGGSKRFIRILMKELPDIPQAVPIRYIGSAA